MFIANLMASVLALAMVGASAASLSKVENNAVRSAENTSFVASPKKAYYDPAGSYGSTNGKMYFYLEGVVFCDFDGYSPKYFDTDVELDIDLNGGGSGYHLVYYSYSLGINSEFFALSDSQPVGNVYTVNSPQYVDVYIDGVFSETLASVQHEYFDDENMQDVQVENYTFDPVFDGTFNSAEHYIWFFDHQDVEPYTPVDILGDIAEGLTGGIVPVAEGIGNGLQSLVQDIFLNADHDGLSVFGIVTICFAGLALALGLSRWVLNFVDTLGARDR